MKKILLAALALLASVSSYAQGEKGDMVLDAGVGYGMMGGVTNTNSGTNGMFTQRVGAEWIICPKMINGDFELSVGAYINNGYASREYTVAGTYDYSYSYLSRYREYGGRWTSWHSNTAHRKGVGTATRSYKRDDVNILPTVSFRYNVNEKFQVYASVGLGVGVLNTFSDEYSNYDGFTTNQTNSDYIQSYYNDQAHAVWDDEVEGTKVCFSMASYVGLRYFFTDRFGVNAQVGLIGDNFAGDWGESFGYISGGVSFRF